MNFAQSIKTCFSKYATFTGRASRSEFWWFILFLALVNALASVLECYALDQCDISDGVLSWLWIFATMLPSLAVGVRRLHDIGVSGWWQLLAIPSWILLFIPLDTGLSWAFLFFFLLTLATWIPLIIMWCFRSETNPAT
ncbi:DUF805 domain-containing protein [Candidatus Spongiihabitans sp.]|uniref:DUF805 domain-containing protein n=1 Tax=Candidatus Spongiihabitans sp. TaxID=3101308 RepID=UPI003C6FB0AC